jgi:hypothetical protein
MSARRPSIAGLAVALVLTAWATPSLAGDVKFSIVCGANASTCTPNDLLKITAAGEVADVKAAWATANVSIEDRDNIKLSLAGGLVPVLAAPDAADRLVNLRPLITEANRRDQTVLAMLYRKPSPTVSLVLLIKREGKADTAFPFVLDLTSLYKDGTLGIVFSEKEGPSCRSPTSRAADCGMGAILDLHIENLAQWSSATGRETKSLVLYLNEIAMTGLASLAGSIEANSQIAQVLSYRLSRDLANANNAKAWRSLLETSPDASMNMSVGVGADSTRWQYAPENTTKLVLPRNAAIPTLIGLLTLAALVGLSFTQTARGSLVLQKSRAAFEAVNPQTVKALHDLKDPVTRATLSAPFSLSMLLMAMWILVVSLSFFAMYYLTQSDNLLNSTALALMGIGAGSLVFARLIDAPTDGDNQKDEVLAKAIRDFAAAPDTANEQAVLTALRAARNQGLITAGPGKWVRDIFSENGTDRLDLHRVQLAAFSFFYAGVFLGGLNSILALPEFSTDTLSLLGISSASYLGYKFASHSGSNA